MVDRTDAELLAAAAAGDGDAFAAFFRRHVRAVTAYAVRRCSSPDEVADLVSDTFAAALQATSRYEPMLPSALPWLFGIERRRHSDQRIGKIQSRHLVGRQPVLVPVLHQRSFVLIQPCRTGRVETHVFSVTAIGDAGVPQAGQLLDFRGDDAALPQLAV